MPVFFLALMLQYIFGSKLHLLPLSGLGGYSPVYLVLPAVTLAATQTIITSLITRSSLEAEISKTYFLAARARGLSFGQTLIHHGFRNALGPVITLLALDLGSLMGGAIITETVYAWPGIGRMTYFAAQSRDIPLILGVVIFLVIVFVTLNSVVDVLYGVLNPKIRWTGADR
jgi:ABC-type dipeptide/oligopeptide/nickel transport system permease component